MSVPAEVPSAPTSDAAAGRRACRRCRRVLAGDGLVHNRIAPPSDPQLLARHKLDRVAVQADVNEVRNRPVSDRAVARSKRRTGAHDVDPQQATEQLDGTKDDRAGRHHRVARATLRRGRDTADPKQRAVVGDR